MASEKQKFVGIRVRKPCDVLDQTTEMAHFKGGRLPYRRTTSVRVEFRRQGGLRLAHVFGALLRYAFLPGSRVSMKVDDAEDEDRVSLDAVEDPLRKPMQDGPTCLAVQHLILKRVLGHAVQRAVYLGDELPPQP